jgi:hypothetical protein
MGVLQEFSRDLVLSYKSATRSACKLFIFTSGCWSALQSRGNRSFRFERIQVKFLPLCIAAHKHQ